MKSRKAAYFMFVIFVLAFCLLFVVVESVNSKLYTSDFKVYYGAVNDFFAGINPYIEVYGVDTGHFKYPPFTMYLFSFYGVLSYQFAQGTHLFLLCSSLVISVLIWHKLLRERSLKKFRNSGIWIAFIAFLFIVLHVTRELHLGNVNLILLGLFSTAIYCFTRNKIGLTILLLSLMVILKPITIFIFIPFLVYGQWRIVIGSGLMGFFFFLFPIIHVGFSGNIELWMNWLEAITSHGEYIVSENSLTYLTEFYLDISSQWFASIIILLVLILFLIYDRFVVQKDKKNYLFWLPVFLAFTPNFFVTDTEHFLLSLPLIMSFVFFIRERPTLLKVGFLILVFLLMSINSNDLLGRYLSDNLDRHGILGLGNLILIGSYTFFYFKDKMGEEKGVLSHENEVLV